MKTKSIKNVVVDLVSDSDFKKVTKTRYFFNWKNEKKHILYKLSLIATDEILGLVSLEHFPDEKRIEIKLIAVSKENRGKNKLYEGIIGNLIAHTCREALRAYAEYGCVSLLPKTELKNHYIKKYRMTDAGMQVFIEKEALLKLTNTYEV